jgi:hypothetical protein
MTWQASCVCPYPTVRGVLSKIPSLRAYDISGNAFNIPSQAARASAPASVHAVLHIDADTRHLCPGAPIAGLATDCGEMVHEPENTNLGLLDCAVRAAGPSTCNKTIRCV